MKKLLVALMCVIMVFSLMPTMAFGDTEPKVAQNPTAEAKIGDIEYATLEEAFENVGDNQYVVLLNDVTLDEKIIVKASYVKLDLNGHKITATTEDKLAFEVMHPYCRFAIYDGANVYETEIGVNKELFDAKVYVGLYSSASISLALYDGSQIIYDNMNNELVVCSDWIYVDYLDSGADTYRFSVSTEENISFYYACLKCGDIYWGNPNRELFNEFTNYLELDAPIEEVGYIVDVLPIEPDGVTMNPSWWGGYGLKKGNDISDTLDLEYDIAMTYYPDEWPFYFHEVYFPGYKIIGWKEVLQYDVDYENMKVIDLVLGDEVTEITSNDISICPIWAKVEKPTIEANTSVEKVLFVTDEKEQEKAIRATNKLINDIAAGKDTDIKVDNDIDKMIRKALAGEIELFSIYADTKIETIEIGSTASADISLISDKIEEGTVAEYIDLSVELSVIALGSDLIPAAGNIYEMDEEMTFNIAIPKELKDVPAGTQREFYVIRVHEGQTEVLDVTINDDGTLSFKTDKFSTYALVYNDTQGESGGESAADSTTPAVPNTGDMNGMLPCMALILLMGAGAVYFKKREN